MRPRADGKPVFSLALSSCISSAAGESDVTSCSGEASLAASRESGLCSALSSAGCGPLSSGGADALAASSCRGRALAKKRALDLRGETKGSKIKGKMGVKWDSRDGLDGHQPTASRCDFYL